MMRQFYSMNYREINKWISNLYLDIHTIVNFVEHVSKILLLDLREHIFFIYTTFLLFVIWQRLSSSVTSSLSLMDLIPEVCWVLRVEQQKEIIHTSTRLFSQYIDIYAFSRHFYSKIMQHWPWAPSIHDIQYIQIDDLRRPGYS